MIAPDTCLSSGPQEPFLVADFVRDVQSVAAELRRRTMPPPSTDRAPVTTSADPDFESGVCMVGDRRSRSSMDEDTIVSLRTA